MRVLVATDSFKDALPAHAVCSAIAEGLRTRGIATIEHPMADGGEGTLDVLATHLKLDLIEARVSDPLRRARQARFGLRDATAFVEAAEAIGLQLLQPHERNPLATSSYGLGEVLRAACQRGAKRCVITVGGTATCDAGIGMLVALGWRVVDAQGRDVDPTGGALNRIAQVVAPSSPCLFERVDILCDVDNPLFGPLGAAHCYAPQKGASRDAVQMLDAGLRHFAFLADPTASAHGLAGAGAAGGISFAAHVFLDARLLRGTDYLLDATKFDEALRGADLVITGEGKLDAQSFRGKLISGICRRAAIRGVPVIALCGRQELAAKDLRHLGLHAAYEITAGQPVDFSQTARRLLNLAATVELPQGG